MNGEADAVSIIPEEQKEFSAVDLGPADATPNAHPHSSIRDYPTIKVGNPEKHGDGVRDAFLTFDCTTTAPASTAGGALVHVVKRRYQDFVHLHRQLRKAYPSALLPPLPERHGLIELIVDRFSPDFIKRRQASLERYLARMSRHPVLGQSQLFTSFLEKDYLSDCEAAMEETSASLEALESSAPERDTAKKSPSDSPGVSKMLRTVNILEGHLATLAKHQTHLLKSLVGLATACQDSSGAYEQLSGLIDLGAEDSTSAAHAKAALARMASLSTATARHLDAQSEEEELEWLGVLQEFEAFLQYSVRTMLREWETASADSEKYERQIEGVCVEREQLLSGMSGPEPGLAAVSSYLSAKLDQLKGLDPIAARHQRLQKLEQRLLELRQAAGLCTTKCALLATTAEPEFKLWQEAWARELQHCIAKQMERLEEHEQARKREWQEMVEWLSSH